MSRSWRVFAQLVPPQPRCRPLRFGRASQAVPEHLYPQSCTGQAYPHQLADSAPILWSLDISYGTFGADRVSIDRSMLTLSGLRWCCGTRLTWIWVVQRAHLAVGGDLVIFPLVFGVLGFRLRFPSIFPGREVISINLSAGCPNTRKRSISPTS